MSNNSGTMKQSSRLAFISFVSVWSIHAQYSASITSAASIDTANRVSGARSSSLLMTIRQKRLQRLVHSYIPLHGHQSCSKAVNLCQNCKAARARYASARAGRRDATHRTAGDGSSCRRLHQVKRNASRLVTE